MLKRALVILAGLIVWCIGMVAFDGAPIPYGRPGKLPEPINQYQIYKEKEIGSLNKTDCGLELYYKAPEGAEIEYVLKDAEGNCLLSGVENDEGKIVLVLKKPEAGKAYSIKLETVCKITKVRTKLELEKLDKPKIIGTWNRSYVVSCGQDGYVDFEERESF